MASSLAPNAGSMPPAGTPASEKSIYYDAGGNDSGQAQGGDVARKPTITSGGIDHPQQGNVRDSGYAQGNVPVHDTKKNAAFASGSPTTTSRQQDVHDPSPAYVEDEKRLGHGATRGSKKEKKESAQSPVQPPAAAAAGMPAATTAAVAGGATPAEGAGASATGAPGGGGEKRHVTGAFANGAGITGPDAIPDDNPAQQERSMTAESQITEDAKKKINKGEEKDAKRLMKVIKSEGKAQSSNLTVVLKELSRLQKIQKQASKDESKALKAHNKATANAHDSHNKYLSAKTTYDHAEADATARKDALEAARARAAETTRELADKSREAEELRRAKMVDDREREARLQQLSGVNGGGQN